MRELDKFQGCLIGGAMGDALGVPVEFSWKEEIFQNYGPQGITDFDLNARAEAEISDDTQMSLFTAQGLLMAENRRKEAENNKEAREDLDIPEYVEAIFSSYQDWFRTQTEAFPLSNPNPENPLLKESGLFFRRAPGSTCMHAIADGKPGSIDRPLNNSKGCGGIMRVAPIGLYFNDQDRFTPKEIALLAAEVAALTHGHELGYIPAAMLAYIIHKISQDQYSIEQAVKESMQMAQELFELDPDLDILLPLCQKAIDLSKKDMKDIDAIEQLGEGWVAEETLAIAIYCALKYSQDFEKALIAAVNHDGDSDSTGAVTGNILGAALGYQALPEKFLNNLELKDLILDLSEKLYEAKARPA